mmetsp:Transcript_724/g.2429  ORF Transcript_724/g.2429 Transcript_724/m.2429 type:complete len:122 (-) Transcript_724:10-375(-)
METYSVHGASSGLWEHSQFVVHHGHLCGCHLLHCHLNDNGWWHTIKDPVLLDSFDSPLISTHPHVPYNQPPSQPTPSSPPQTFGFLPATRESTTTNSITVRLRVWVHLVDLNKKRACLLIV